MADTPKAIADILHKLNHSISGIGKREVQPKNNFFQSAIPPLSNSQIKLPGGKTEPYYYCLGVDSTVPFVSLQGGGASQKVFTWGEMIEVLPGQTVIVRNESYMLGDIQINSGHDFAAKPERISLPVDVDIVDSAGIFGSTIRTITPKFPADTRRCRRGYLKYQIQAQTFSLGLVFTGKPIKHSFPAIDSATGQQTYTQVYNIPPFTLDGEAPMGYGSNDNLLTPMGFTDQTSWNLSFLTALPLLPTFVPPFVNTLFMYVLEY
jgi:hypothetical protein